MERKEKYKISNILKILVFTFILLILTLGLNNNVNAVELFSDTVLWHGIPHNVTGLPKLWCSDYGKFVEPYMDCSPIMRTLEGSGTKLDNFKSVGGTREDKTFYMFDTTSLKRDVWNWNATGSDIGVTIAETYTPLFDSYKLRQEVEHFIDDLNSATNTENIRVDENSGGDRTDFYKKYGSDSGLYYTNEEGSYYFARERIMDDDVGIFMDTAARPALYSIMFNKDGNKLAESSIQAALYIFTEYYDKETGAGYSDEDKQLALWATNDAYNQGTKTAGNGLSDIANLYNQMYDALKGYKERGEAYLKSIDVRTPADEKSLVSEGGGVTLEIYNTKIDKNGKTIEEDTGEKGTFDLYSYYSVWAVDKKDKAYILGPFAIDYSVGIGNYSIDSSSNPKNIVSTRGVVWRDDGTRGSYWDSDDRVNTGWEGVYFNYIKNVTVYNQNKENIVKLGGRFELIDEKGNVIYDGENRAGLQNLKPAQTFYIKVYRGGMQEDFTNFYAKFDFRYLYQIHGWAQRYKPTINKYFYVEDDADEKKEITLQGQYQYKTTWLEDEGWDVFVQVSPGTGHYNKDSNGRYYEASGGNYDFSHHYYNYVEHSKTDWIDKSSHPITLDSYAYTLTKDTADELEDKGQWQTEFDEKSYRDWDERSIVITTKFDEIEPEIDIQKLCQDENNKPLYGATFDITLDIKGTDRFANNINKTLNFTRTTDSDGMIKITADEIDAMGVYLGSFNGTINVTAKETQAPAGHIITQGTYKASKTYDANTKDMKITITAYNRHDTIQDKPVLQLAKIDKDGKYINADFKVNVYVNGASKQTGTISGSTEDGKLVITEKDFNGIGIDIANFSGSMQLQIAEIKTKDNHSIRSNGKNATLTFEKGVLKEYNREDGELMAERNFEDLLVAYANEEKKLEELPEFMGTYISDWIKRQQEIQDTQSDPELKLDYADIMEELKKYVNEHADEVFNYMTKANPNASDGMLQITIENDEGMELPDIPPRHKTYDLTMEIAGYAFLDGTETKGLAHEPDGKLTQGEQMLSGIKVALYDANTNQLATLIQDSKGEEIRTNPAMTDENGFYEFRGVDPLGDYYVVFEYNGVMYKANPANNVLYNSDDWAVTAKATETEYLDSNNEVKKLNDKEMLNRSKYNEVKQSTNVYSYDELDGLYSVVQNTVRTYIENKGEYPKDQTIIDEVKKSKEVSNIGDLDARLNYILKESIVKAKAGYGKDAVSKTYPYNLKFVANGETANALSYESYVALGEEIEGLYPGQKQIHLGLVERDATDLSLLKDVVSSELKLNGHSTVYNYENGDSDYTQYVYEEDYQYDDGSKQNTNKAYYDDVQEPELYITYKITVTNETSTPTKPLEIVDYFDSNFEVVEASVPVDTVSNYGTKANTTDGYSAIFLRPNAILSESSTDITLKLKLKDPKNNLSKYIKTDEGKTVSKVWDVENYAEISAYYTNGSFIDEDSHPGNLSIAKYKEALADYQKARSDYMTGGMTETAHLKVQAAKDRLLEVKEDDAWKVSLNLVNSGYERVLQGNVWEAVSDTVKTATGLQNNDTLLQYIQNNGIEGITVELVELKDSGESKVRATTKTDANGTYKFESYIPGTYVVRFTYGDNATAIRSKITKDSEGKDLQINGQFYQSTKANPNTDKAEYWYAEDTDTRYSDAYDGAQSRAKQIEAEIKNGQGSHSNNYNYVGAVSIDNGTHQDVINAYTSSINVEGEYIKTEINEAYAKSNQDYQYLIRNVDFGLTPRAGVDLQIDKYASNIKVYLQNGVKQLDCSFEYGQDENGNKVITNVVYNNDNQETKDLVNLVIANYGSQTFLDGLIEVLMDDQLYNGAQLEVTYTISVDNKSEYDTLRWVINGGNKVGVVYYENEDYTKLPYYEQGNIIYQDDARKTYSKTTGTLSNEEKIVRTSAKNIIDYVEPNLQFTTKNFIGGEINKDWEYTNKESITTSRTQEIMAPYNELLKAKEGSNLLKELKPGEKAETTLTLVTTLRTSASETNDYEYHNLIEITQMGNTSGRVKKIEYYNVDGKATSADTYKEEERQGFLPTLGTSKSETILFHASTGLQNSKQVYTNVIIVFVSLVILAGGIVLIKKFVLKPKTE